ncbi:papilin-like [Pecten maximus]|uniref:papilin-like n=1 Tax=Pecten maximus TaxID=6579 RepID=UPI001459091B|nr:papilin-like [Pecten maximus]
MAAYTVLLFITVLVSLCCQISAQLGGPDAIPGRYRNPKIIRYYSFFCRNIQCGFEAVCERQTYPCLIPTCSDGPSCVQTPGASLKPGRCPRPSYIRARGGGGRRYECNTDYGCSGRNICCHGYRISRCMRPRRPRQYPRKY